MFEVGQQIVKNTAYSDADILDMLNHYGTDEDLTESFLEGEPFDIIEFNGQGIRTAQHPEYSPWIPKGACMIYESILNEGVEL